MGKNEQKTKQTRVSPAAFLKKVAGEQQLADSLRREGCEAHGEARQHKAGAGCVYVKQLDDLDRSVLRQVAKSSLAELRRRYPA